MAAQQTPVAATSVHTDNSMVCSISTSPDIIHRGLGHPSLLDI
jgi:hypothetical protein